MPDISQDERERETTHEGQPRTTQEEDPRATQDDRQSETPHGVQAQDLPREEPEPQDKSAEDLVGQQIVDPHGTRIGKIEALLTHSDDERASWARVKIDLIGTSSVIIPLHDAQDDGGRIRVVYEKERVKEAPEIEPDGNELSDAEANKLRGHYGLERTTGLSVEGADDIELSREARDADPPSMKEGERPWAVEKYPLPDMDRPEAEPDRPEGESSDREGS